MRERVYMVWDIYDGIRSGIADYGGRPHYFQCCFDNQIGDFSEKYDLKPIDLETLRLAEEQWSIYRAWEFKYHSGAELLENHPGGGCVNERYDELEKVLKSRIEKTSATKKVRASFTPKDHQPTLPKGCLRDMEVDWS